MLIFNRYRVEFFIIYTQTQFIVFLVIKNINTSTNETKYLIQFLIKILFK